MTTRHYFSEHQDITEPVACGGRGYNFGAVTDRAKVTCKRCLASLAKRDREFQRKARVWFSGGGSLISCKDETGGWLVGLPGEEDVRLSFHPRVSAARAIAREEGRAL